MFLKSSKIFHDKNSGSSLSIIAQGIDFSGEINTEGDIHLDGKMKGNIKAQEVVVGPEGVFDGEIIANILVVSGSIKGKFTIKNLHVKKRWTFTG
jgi:cytoskeletal protein CcmA (bactofilin family)